MALNSYVLWETLTLQKFTQGQFGRLRSGWVQGVKRGQSGKWDVKVRAGFDNVPGQTREYSYVVIIIFWETSSANEKLRNGRARVPVGADPGSAWHRDPTPT